MDALLKITFLLAFLNNGNKPAGTVPPKELGTLRSLSIPPHLYPHPAKVMRDAMRVRSSPENLLRCKQSVTGNMFLQDDKICGDCHGAALLAMTDLKNQVSLRTSRREVFA